MNTDLLATWIPRHIKNLGDVRMMRDETTGECEAALYGIVGAGMSLAAALMDLDNKLGSAPVVS